MSKILALAVGFLLVAPFAAAEDFHTVFEARCLRCHGHAGTFARETLLLADGEVRGRQGRDLVPFLSRHAGGLTADQIALFLNVFKRQIASGGLYQRKCEICHDNAYTLARLKLIHREGRLIGRYTGRDIAKFFLNHGRLSAAEAAEMTDALSALRKGAR